MPFYDLQCSVCKRIIIDKFESVNESRPNCEECAGVLERAWLPGSQANVLGDEIDITIKHGVCNDDGSPRRFRSREELKKAQAGLRKRGMEHYDRHVGEQGSDKSRFTTRWI